MDYPEKVLPNDRTVMRQPAISICIPTFNRKNCLRETILGILSQVDSANRDYIEICISDNASTDGTELLVADLQKNAVVNIVYSKHQSNLGADLNFIKVVSLASGEYCWLMGSDDVAVPGSINSLLNEIKSRCDIYLINRIDCDIRLQPINKRWWLKPSVKTSVFNLSNSLEFGRYAHNANSTGALFSYLSSIIFKRQKWQEIEICPEFLKTSYVHVFVLCSFIKSGCLLKYIDSHLVNSRGGNDSFLKPDNDGVVNRIMLDINGYSMICEKLFQDSNEYSKGVLRILHAERPQLKTISVLRLRSKPQDWPGIAAKLREAGYQSAFIWLIQVLESILPFLQFIYRKVWVKTKF